MAGWSVGVEVVWAALGADSPMYSIFHSGRISGYTSRQSGVYVLVDLPIHVLVFNSALHQPQKHQLGRKNHNTCSHDINNQS